MMGLRKFNMLLRLMVLGCAWSAHAQLSCSQDAQCSDDFYCENNTCRECLRCEAYARQTPLHPDPCIKSVVKCGPCQEGLVEDSTGDVNAACVSPQPPFSTSWLVAVIVVAVAVFLLGCGLILYLLRKKGIFKMHAYLGASVESPPEPPRASAPVELPPPYVRYDSGQPPRVPAPMPMPAPHTVFVNGVPGAGSGLGAVSGPGELRPPSPAPDSRAASPYDSLHAYTEEAARQPFIKRASPPQRARTAAGRQAARVFNRPAYVYPSSPEPPVYSDASDNEGFAPHDEDTVESEWTPAATPGFGDGIAAAAAPTVPAASAGPAPAALSAQLDAARGTVLLRAPREPLALPPPAKKNRYAPHDSNNNGSEAGGEPSPSGCASGSTAGAGAGAAIKVNLQATLQLTAGAGAGTLQPHHHAPHEHRHTHAGDPLPR